MDTEQEFVVGIDLGTTNSEIAAYTGKRVEVLGIDGRKILPSCVGISPQGQLLVGHAARNQQLIYPDRTVRSIKRKMGTDETVKLGDKTFTPQEISSLILRELANWAERATGKTVKKAVITVPAYFNDAQRHATKEAGALAGLEVVRILNEPTAASIAYGSDGKKQKVMVYDLGGGTFDVSIVQIEGDVTEVLASHGNTRLGGDDFNDLLVKHMAKTFKQRHGLDLLDGHPAAYARLWVAAEEAKHKLSEEPYAMVREETLATEGNKPLHLELEISRREYEEMIRPMIEATMDSVSKAMHDAGLSSNDLDTVLLVGGSTRTPLVSEVLEHYTGKVPRQDVHPDLCVALGAGLLASRIAGVAVDKVLVDVTPHSFGVAAIDELNGRTYGHCFVPIIHRNTALPVTRTKQFATASPFQDAVEILVYQGENRDALKNILVGDFTVSGLRKISERNEVLCRMHLDLNGILNVTAIEKETGLSMQITIEKALAKKSDKELQATRKRMLELFATRLGSPDVVDENFENALEVEAEDNDEFDEMSAINVTAKEIEDEDSAAVTDQLSALKAEAQGMLDRMASVLQRMHSDDQADAQALQSQIEKAIVHKDEPELTRLLTELRELLFFVEDL